MLVGGCIVFVFIVYHLLHYTAEVQYLNFTHQNFAAFMEQLPGQVPPERHDIFKMMVVGFSNPWVSGFYVLGLALLCLHLSHGASSMFQSLGWKNEAYRPFLDKAAQVVAWLIFIGYTSIPLAILCGYGKEALEVNLDAKIPAGPLAAKWDQHKFDVKAGQPGQQAQVRHHRRRQRPGRRVGRRLAGRAGLPGQMLLLPGQPAPRPQHRRPGRHQRRQELPNDGDSVLSAVLRHDQRAATSARARPTSIGWRR